MKLQGHYRYYGIYGNSIGLVQICQTTTTRIEEAKRSVLLAYVEEIQCNLADTSVRISKDICNKCLLGEWLTEEPYALIGHMRWCEGLLRLESLIAEKSKIKGSEKSRQRLLDGFRLDYRIYGMRITSLGF